MAKSNENPKTYITLLDSPDVIIKKIKSAVTDNENKVYYDEVNKPGISNLLNIFCAFSNKTLAAATKHFKNADYGTFKEAVATIVVEQLTIIQKKYYKIIETEEWKQWIIHGQKKARAIAQKKLQLIQDKIGINY